MVKNKCKMLITCQNGIQIAIDQNNTVFLRTFGRGYKGDCWGTWHTFDLNPKAWKKSDHTSACPYENKEAWPIKQEVLDGLELLMDTTR